MTGTVLRYRYLILLAVGILLAGAAYASERSRLAGRTQTAADLAPFGELGPTEGDVEAYVRDRRDMLALLAADTPGHLSGGLVSLQRMLTAQEAEALTSSAPDTVALLFLRLPGAPPSSVLVEGSVTGAFVSVAGEPDPHSELGAERCRCVYAFVVHGWTLGSLLTLQAHPDVRLVDVPDDPVAELRGYELIPLLPRD